jgi:hypothetical protein
VIFGADLFDRVVRFADRANRGILISARRKDKIPSAAFARALSSSKTSAVVVTFRRATFVLPNGLKIVRASKSTFSKRIRKTTHGSKAGIRDLFCDVGERLTGYCQVVQLFVEGHPSPGPSRYLLTCCLDIHRSERENPRNTFANQDALQKGIRKCLLIR